MIHFYSNMHLQKKKIRKIKRSKSVDISLLKCCWCESLVFFLNEHFSRKQLNSKVKYLFIFKLMICLGINCSENNKIFINNHKYSYSTEFTNVNKQIHIISFIIS